MYALLSGHMLCFVHGIAQIVRTVEIAYDKIEIVGLIYDVNRFGVSLLNAKGEIDSSRS